MLAPVQIMRVLDTYCKAGGASSGYADAGFDVTGVDIEPQPNYPFTFHQADAITYIRDHGHEYDLIVGSPPCQGYSVTRHRRDHKGEHHPKLINATREAMIATGRPYVIENVEGSQTDLINPIKICGSSLGLRLRRHRFFESSFPIIGTPCDHLWQRQSKIYTVRLAATRNGGSRLSGTVPIFGNCQLLFDGKPNAARELMICREVMETPWMTKWEMNQAIPPAYTRHIGRQALHFLSTINGQGNGNGKVKAKGE